MSLPSRAVVLSAAMLACTAACAADAGTDAVTVTTTRDPVDKSYRKMLKGMDLFEAMRALAPDAALRYKLLPRQRDTDMNGIELNVDADTFTTPVPVAADHTFTLERDSKALDEDASVRPNRKARSMTWRADIRTPGLPADTRRLGDLRLECHVGMEADLVSTLTPVFGQIANFLLRMTGFCDKSEVLYLYFSERPLFSVTMVSGSRREVLSVDRMYARASYEPLSKEDLAHCDCQVLIDRTFYMPLGDRSWPDDTRIEFEYMDGGNGREAAIAGGAISVGKSTRADVLAALGKAIVVTFDSGFEIWVYRDKESRRGAADRAERVVLFDPSGVVARSRIRPAPPPREGGEK